VFLPLTRRHWCQIDADKHEGQLILGSGGIIEVQSICGLSIARVFPLTGPFSRTFADGSCEDKWNDWLARRWASHSTKNTGRGMGKASEHPKRNSRCRLLAFLPADDLFLASGTVSLEELKKGL
jgi:hypothetical protein